MVSVSATMRPVILAFPVVPMPDEAGVGLMNVAAAGGQQFQGDEVNEARFLTVREFAQLSRQSKSLVYDHISHGRIQAVRLPGNSRMLIPLDEAERHISSAKLPSSAPSLFLQPG